MNGLSPSYIPLDQNGAPPEEYREPIHRALEPVHRALEPVHRSMDPVHRALEPVHRPMDPVHMTDHYPFSSNQPMIKQERVSLENGEVGPGKVVMDHEIQTLTGIISAKEYEVTHFKDYNVHLQKVGNEREFAIDKLKKRLRDVENERDNMEKKWLDQVQSHVKEKYLIADLQKEVLLWKGKFKNLLDRIQGLECDARRDFDFSCRRSSLGEASTNDFIHVTNVITSKGSDQRAIIHVQDGVDKASVIERDAGHHDGAVGHAAVSAGMPRDRVSMPRVYRPEPTYIYGYPSQAVHVSMPPQNGVAGPMKMITAGSEYYEASRRGEMVNGKRPHDGGEEEEEGVVQVNGEEEKELEIDVDGKMDERMVEEGDDALNKRLMLGNKAKIIVRKRNDPTRFLPNHHKRKRMR